MMRLVTTVLSYQEKYNHRNMKMNGADLLVKFLLDEKIDKVFLFPGGTIAPIIDSLNRNKIEILCTRAEQGAGFAALAYSKLSERPCVGIVSSGPGVTNLVTCVADAYFDNVASVFVTGQVATSDLARSSSIRQRGFQEVDTPGLMRPIAKEVISLNNLADIPYQVKRAFEIARSGRPGPVVIDFPMDMQRQEVKDNLLNEADTSFSSFKSYEHEKELELKLRIISKHLALAERPLIIAGNGIRTSSTVKEFRNMVHNLNIPVTQSLSALGVFPTRDSLALGFHGHTGNQAAGMAIHNADFILVLGSRLDVRQTGTLFTQFAPNAFIVHVDIDEAEMEHSRVPTSLRIQTDLKTFFGQFSSFTEEYKPNRKFETWIEQITEWKTRYALELGPDGAFTPQRLIHIINEYINQKFNEDQKFIFTSGVGSHQQWAARHLSFDYPSRTWMTSAGLGTMGYDLPAAIGAQFFDSKAKVVCVVGDGSIQMNIQELATVAEFNLPIIIVVVNNNRLGIVSQFQNLNWGYDKTCGNKYNPNFYEVARAYKLESVRLNSMKDLDENLDFIFNCSQPILVDCNVDQFQDISPMLLANQKIDEMWMASSEKS